MNIIPSMMTDAGKAKLLPSLKETGRMLLTFALAVFGWIIFRAQDTSQFGEVISTVCSDSLLSVPWLMNRQYYIPLLINIAILLIVEWLNRTKEHGLKVLPNNPIARILIYYGIFLLIFFFTGKNETFIYFQF